MMRRGNVAMFILFKSIRTMPATLLTTITATQEIPSGKDHQSIFEVIVLTLFERLWLITHLCFMCLLWLKHKRRTGPASPARRAKAALEIFPIEKIINITEETQLSFVITQRQRITRTQIGL